MRTHIKNNIMTCVTFASVCMMFVGGCGIMDDYGNLQIGSLIIALVGALNLVFISRRFEDVD